MVFADPAGRDFYPEWDRAAHSCVAEIRAAYGVDPSSRRIATVVGELSRASDEFARLWRLHEVRSKTQKGKHLRHPRARPPRPSSGCARRLRRAGTPSPRPRCDPSRGAAVLGVTHPGTGRRIRAR
ncbi:hypothetical protein GCM10025331_77340 [Actinoplanes utahensis]|nr:hypothetical protein Aut01nite_54240 [Actinoplanes utahensis]